MPYVVPYGFVLYPNVINIWAEKFWMKRINAYINSVAELCESNILQPYKICLFFNFRDVATVPTDWEIIMARNAVRKLFRIKPNLI